MAWQGDGKARGRAEELARTRVVNAIALLSILDAVESKEATSHPQLKSIKLSDAHNNRRLESKQTLAPHTSPSLLPSELRLESDAR